MLLQKIKTRGFLGHLAAADSENGSTDYVELDFTNTSLSLVHGANGAGKSTFWDALLFSFFKEHRGGGSNFARLIHDRADDAEIIVEFLLDDGLTYEIYSKISKRGKGANVTRSVWLVNGKNRETRGESDAAVGDWINKNLQMSAQTFTSAVLLRQGEADAFLKAKPAKRREILLELLQLDFYRELGTQATKRKNDCKKESERLSDELVNLSNPTDAEIADQRASIETAKTQIENLSKIKGSKNEELSNAKRSASLQNDIAETEKQQKEDAQFLDAIRAAEIRRKYDRFCELERVLLRLENFWNAKNEVKLKNAALKTNSEQIERLRSDLKNIANKLGGKLFQVENVLGGFQKEVQNKRRLASESKKKAGDLKKFFGKMQGEEEKLRGELNKFRGDLRFWRDKINSRNQVTGKPECPLCGSELDNHAAEKIANEIEQAKSQVDMLEKQEKKLTDVLEPMDLKKAQTDYETADEQARKAATDFQIAEAAFKRESEEWQEKFETHKERVENEAETQGSSTAEKLKKLSQDVRGLEKEQTEIQSNLETEKRATGYLEDDLVRTKQKLNDEQGKIPVMWQNHAACENELEFEALRKEKDVLSHFEGENRSLTEAENRKANLEGKLELLKNQLDEIPPSHHRPVSDVENEIVKITDDIKEADDNLKLSDNQLREMENQQKAYEGKKIETSAANKNLRLWQKLAEAFGKKGLEARIVQTAQETVKTNANKILGALCDSFQIKLEESANEEELEIYVHDSNTQNADEKGRPFEYFSGGESLLIAVSLAVGIGQAVTGKNAANTLIIDEGFGALDDSRREFLVRELQRLSDEVLQDGRVIVVSHQDNVKEKFNRRYHLEKDEKGFVKVGVDASI